MMAFFLLMWLIGATNEKQRKALADYLGLPDASIEIKLTPNRADCFSVRGIGHDVAAALAGEVAPLESAPVAAATAATLDVSLEAGERVVMEAWDGRGADCAWTVASPVALSR